MGILSIDACLSDLWINGSGSKNPIVSGNWLSGRRMCQRRDTGHKSDQVFRKLIPRPNRRWSRTIIFINVLARPHFNRILFYLHAFGARGHLERLAISIECTQNISALRLSSFSCSLVNLANFISTSGSLKILPRQTRIDAMLR